MHWLDIILLVVLALGAALGARKGLLWQVARIVTFGVAIYVCIYYHGFAAGLMAPYLDGASEMLLKVLACGVTFLTVYLVLYGITLLLERAVKASRLKLLDRFLGALFGAVKAGLLAGAVLMGVALLGSPQADATLAESSVAPVLLLVMRGVIVAVPQEYKDELTAALDRIKKAGADRAEELGNAAVRKAIEDQFNQPTPPTAKGR
jgi:membrane protein required for colicin V production